MPMPFADEWDGGKQPNELRRIAPRAPSNQVRHFVAKQRMQEESWGLAGEI